MLEKHADWRGDGNTRKRTKHKCHHASEVFFLPAPSSPIAKKKVTFEWGKKPTCCLSTEPRPNIHTAELEGSAHHFLPPLLNAWGVWRSKEGKQTNIAVYLKRRLIFPVDTNCKSCGKFERKKTNRFGCVFLAHNTIILVLI